MKRKKNKRTQVRRHYTMLDVLMASPSTVMSLEKRESQLSRMYAALDNLESAPVALPNDWRIVSDCVNLMETLVTAGPWLDLDGATHVNVPDPDGLLVDAITALAMAGRRHQAGKPLRLDGPGIRAVRAVLEDYAALIGQLSERVLVAVHLKTEKRIADILAGRRQQHDVEVVDL